MNLDLRFVATLSVPAFWIGCAREVADGMHPDDGDSAKLRDHVKIARYEAIVDQLNAGVLLQDIPGFRDWSASIRVKPSRAPDPLDVVRPGV